MNEFFDDEKFMNRFNNRLHLEAAPKWAAKKQPFPWLEIGWAAAAALLLGLYWTELRFGLLSLNAVVSYYAAHVPVSFLLMGLALAGGLAVWIAPKLIREL